MLPAFAAAFRKLIEESHLALADFEGIAVGFCGLVDTDRSRVLSTNKKYDDAPSLDLQDWARQDLGLPLRLENDARMALLGERAAGAARGFDDIVMITLGTGVGGAAMIGGQLLRGKHYRAGCLGGHLPVAYDGRPCTCGGAGCMEAHASGWALPGICREWPGFAGSALACERGDLDFATLFRASDSGDPVAREIVAHCIRIWSVGTVGLVHAYDPEVVVIGGGVMQRGDEILAPVRRYVEENSWAPCCAIQFRAAELGSDAGLLGAASLLREALD
jgi:glucokinase